MIESDSPNHSTYTKNTIEQNMSFGITEAFNLSFTNPISIHGDKTSQLCISALLHKFKGHKANNQDIEIALDTDKNTNPYNFTINLEPTNKTCTIFGRAIVEAMLNSLNIYLIPYVWVFIGKKLSQRRGKIMKEAYKAFVKLSLDMAVHDIYYELNTINISPINFPELNIGSNAQNAHSYYCRIFDRKYFFQYINNDYKDKVKKLFHKFKSNKKTFFKTNKTCEILNAMGLAPISELINNYHFLPGSLETDLRINLSEIIMFILCSIIGGKKRFKIFENNLKNSKS